MIEHAHDDPREAALLMQDLAKSEARRARNYSRSRGAKYVTACIEYQQQAAILYRLARSEYHKAFPNTSPSGVVVTWGSYRSARVRTAASDDKRPGAP